MKISILGCGLRTPLLLSGLLRTGRRPQEVALYDLDPAQAELMLALGSASEPDSQTRLSVAHSAEDAIDGSDYVICSIRPGGMEGRASDERIALDQGYAGQETIGPAGCIMAWRSIPAVLGFVRIMERLAPQAWLINFTNPAGVVTQAVNNASAIRAIGICDTPAELFFRIALSFGVGLEEVHCEYAGLNHCGFVRRVEIRGQDRTNELLNDNDRLASLYPADLFPPELIRHLGLIPSEYLFFYYRPLLAKQNQLLVGRTRGEELLSVNRDFYRNVHAALRDNGPAAGLAVYAHYLNHRNASYLKLEGSGGSAIDFEIPDWDPFAAVTGYHRIAVEAIQALCGQQPARMVLNVANEGAIPGFEPRDVVEIHCNVSAGNVARIAQAALPQSIAGLIESTKEYERLLAQAALAGDRQQLAWAMVRNPLVNDWDAGQQLTSRLLAAHSGGVG